MSRSAPTDGTPTPDAVRAAVLAIVDAHGALHRPSAAMNLAAHFGVDLPGATVAERAAALAAWGEQHVAPVLAALLEEGVLVEMEGLPRLLVRPDSPSR